MFFATYITFANCSEVFERLCHHYMETTVENPQSHAHLYVLDGLQLSWLLRILLISILSVMLYWVESRYMPADPLVLTQMQEFVGSIAGPARLASKIAVTIEQRVNLQEREQKLLQDVTLASTPNRPLLNHTPAQIAAALTVWEGLRYRRICPADYLIHLVQNQGSGRIIEARMVTEKISVWVKQEILHCAETGDRVERLEFFVKVADVSLLSL